MSVFTFTVLSFLWEIAKIGVTVSAARIAFIIYGYEKGIFIDSH